jgi:hypothetical protein
MTPEKEKEIRELAKIDSFNGRINRELLAEIDRLREENRFFEETYHEATEIYKRQGLRDSLEYGAQLERVVLRFSGLLEAYDQSYNDDVIIRCEVSAGDMRSLKEALSKIRGEK